MGWPKMVIFDLSAIPFYLLPFRLQVFEGIWDYPDFNRRSFRPQWERIKLEITSPFDYSISGTQNPLLSFVQEVCLHFCLSLYFFLFESCPTFCFGLKQPFRLNFKGFRDSWSIVECAHQRHPERHLFASDRVILAIMRICTTLGSAGTRIREKYLKNL